MVYSLGFMLHVLVQNLLVAMSMVVRLSVGLMLLLGRRRRLTLVKTKWRKGKNKMEEVKKQNGGREKTKKRTSYFYDSYDSRT